MNLTLSVGKSVARERGMVSKREIRALVDRIGEVFQPERVILFGSYAYGVPGPHSDVDLLVLLPFEGRNLRKSLEILNAVNPPFSVDLLARRPDDTQRRYEQGDPLIREALDRGEVLYERNCQRMGEKSRSRLQHRKPRVPRAAKP